MAVRVIICRSNPIAPDPRVEKIARTLDRFGFEVTLLGWDRTGTLPEIEQWGGERGNTNLAGAEGNPKVIQVYRLPLVAPFGHGLGNLPNLLRWQVRLLRWLINRQVDFDLIHACDFDTILPALFLKIFYSKKVIYDIFDFYADHLRSTPEWIKNSIRFIDRKAIRLADGLILADESRWSQITGTPIAGPDYKLSRRSAVIYNSPSLDDLQIAQKSTSLLDPDLEKVPERHSGNHPSEKLRLAYIGLLQRERGLIEMINVLKKHPEWTLDIAGFGGDEGMLVEMVETMPNVHWYGRIPYDQALLLSQTADVLFATYDPAIPNHRYSSPNKVFEAMLLAKPIIVAYQTNMDQIVTRADCGIVVKYGDVALLEEALIRLQNDPDLRVRLGENGFRAYQTTYSWQEMENRLLNLYQAVMVENNVR